jgi:hypothetical protein
MKVIFLCLDSGLMRTLSVLQKSIEKWLSHAAYCVSISQHCTVLVSFNINRSCIDKTELISADKIICYND